MLDTHAQYLLDCAIELGELSPMEYAVLAYDRDSQAAFTAAAERLVGSDAIPNFARDRLNAMPKKQCHVLALSIMSAPGLPGLWESYQGRVSFLIELKIGEDLGWRNKSPIHVWGDRGEKLFNSELDICEPMVTQYLKRECTSVLGRWDSDIRIFQEAKEWGVHNPSALHAELSGQLNQMAKSLQVLRAQGKLTRPAALGNGQSKESFLKTLRAEQARAKRAVKKAFKLFESQGKVDKVGLLVSGSEVIISHPSSEFKFVVKPHSAGWLLSKTVNPGGSTPFTLELYTKEDLYLARLCVLFKDTPVLDQLMALSLFIESGEESTLLEQANWFGVNEEGIAWVESKKPEYQSKVVRLTQNDLQTLMDPFFEIRGKFAPYEGVCRQWALQHLQQRASFEALPASLQTLMMEYKAELSDCFNVAQEAAMQKSVETMKLSPFRCEVELI